MPDEQKSTGPSTDVLKNLMGMMQTAMENGGSLQKAADQARLKAQKICCVCGNQYFKARVHGYGNLCQKCNDRIALGWTALVSNDGGYAWFNAKGTDMEHFSGKIAAVPNETMTAIMEKHFLQRQMKHEPAGEN